MRSDGCICDDRERWREHCPFHREADEGAPGPVIVTIRRTSDGVTRTLRDVWRYSIDGLRYQYGDGNYACDDNRELFFARAGGEDAPDDTPCSHGRFDLSVADEASGVILYGDGSLSP